MDRSPSGARREAKARLTPPIDRDRSVVVVMTGSLGSTRVNAAVRELADRWSARRDRTILHVTGRRDYVEYLAPEAPRARGSTIASWPSPTWSELWRVCDVAICRAGAITVAELTALAVPSILVPLPGAPDDHQTKNAQAVVRGRRRGAVPTRDCTGAALATTLDEVVTQSTLDAMAEGSGATLAHRRRGRSHRPRGPRRAERRS